MDKIISCAINIDTACVKVKYADGSMRSLDCTRAEKEVARNAYGTPVLCVRQKQKSENLLVIATKIDVSVEMCEQIGYNLG